jgi:hypothetical protein
VTSRERLMRHARQRLKERCGVKIEHKKYLALCEHLRRGGDGDGAIAFCDSGDPVFKVTLKGVPVYAIWSPREELIYTFIADLGYRQWLQAEVGVVFA